MSIDPKPAAIERTAPPSVIARQGDAAALREALAQARSRSLAMLSAWRQQCGDALPIDYHATVNPLRWELGHLGWFEDWWIGRNPQRHRGVHADPLAAREAPRPPEADRWYDSSKVEHRSRWALDLPPVSAIVDHLAQTRDATQEALRAAAAGDDALYFFRLALAHEHMHDEAWVMMAQRLGIEPGDVFASLPPATFAAASGELDVAATTVTLGSIDGAGFMFDNECGRRDVPIGPFTIDREPVTWARYLPFIEQGGYDDARWWTADGWAWRQGQPLAPLRHPRHLRRTAGGHWQQRHFATWRALDEAHAASHLTWHEAQAWCRWARRALPTEAQWRAGQARHPEAFTWGDVWEWTASPFAPFDGFTPHPYRDYSQPWFDGRPVLKGASRWTHPQQHDARYRNFFMPDRDDVLAGFRSVALPRAA